MEGHDWQVLNELDSGRGQGWGGTLEDYLLFTQYTNDAIQTVYNLPALQGKTFRLYAPVAKSRNTWVAESLRLNTTMIDRIDWHNYSTSHYDNAVQARAWSAQYSPSAGSDNTMRLSRFMVYYASHHRRHPPWRIYSIPTCRIAPQSSWI